jgi:DNA-binding CsgD family transcriptional regulator
VHDPLPSETLTPRQRQIAALVARGYTNRQIADELVLARGTVANHVQAILDRLNGDSRAQIAVWAAEHGLTASQDRFLTALSALLALDTSSVPVALRAAEEVLRDALSADHVRIDLDVGDDRSRSTGGNWSDAISVTFRRGVVAGPREEAFLNAAARWLGMLDARAKSLSVRNARETVARELVLGFADDLGRQSVSMRRGAQRAVGRAHQSGRRRDLAAAQRMAQSARRLEDVVRDLDHLVRLEGSELDLSLQLVDVGRLVREAVAPLRRGRAPVDIRVHAPETIHACVDAARARQAVELVVAEMAHGAGGAGGGGVLVDVALETPAGGEPLAMLRISQLRAQPSAPSDLPLNALRIDLASRIVAAHGGALRQSSSPAGRQFTLTLPLRATRYV